MPEQRLQRTRATLPSGYQFGDAGVCEFVPVTIVDRRDIQWPSWRALHENAAEQLQREYVTDRDCGDERTT